MKGKRHGNFKDRTGERNINNQGCWMEIIECNGDKDNTIRFDNGFIVYKREYRDFKKGVVKNLLYPSVCGIGYEGVGKYSRKEHVDAYIRWRNILIRVSSNEYHEKQPTYIGCSIFEEWLNFQNFAPWFYENFKYEYMKGWELDKDILIKGNKHYSPETCCFVPKEINSLFTKRQNHRGQYPIGVKKNCKKFSASCMIDNKDTPLGTRSTPEEAFYLYKPAKEKEIKRIADKWRGQITEKCYQAMYNYQVEITD